MAHLISMHFIVMPDLGFINECQDHMIVLVTLKLFNSSVFEIGSDLGKLPCSF